MNVAPVVLFVYNRLDHTRQTVAALARNALASSTDLFIYSDAEKDGSQADAVAGVREYVHSIQGFHQVVVRERAANWGLANSIIDGVSTVIADRGRAIVLEDDIVCSTDFLDYMNGALDYYVHDKHVFSISGYAYPGVLPTTYRGDTYMLYRSCSYGWATWVDRWQEVDWAVSDYSSFRINLRAMRRFARGTDDVLLMLQQERAGFLESWAIRCYYAQARHDQWTLYPRYSKVENIGCDGSGVHGYDGRVFGQQAISSPHPTVLLAGLAVDSHVNAAMTRVFRVSWRRRLVVTARLMLGERVTRWMLGTVHGIRHQLRKTGED